MSIKKSGNITVYSEKYKRKFLIDISYVPSEKRKPIVLFVHGFKGFKDWGAFNLMADYFAKAEFVFVKMNFSHNGTTIEQPLDFVDLEAFGNNNFSIEQDDLRVVLNRLFKNDVIDSAEVNLDELYLIGHSRGGAAAILKASQDDRIKKIATLAAINDFSSSYPEEVMSLWRENGVYYVYNGRTKQQMPLYYQIVEDFNKNEKLLNIKNAVKEMNKPFLALHGTADETLPIVLVHQIKQWNEDVRIVELNGMNHTFGSVHPYCDVELPKDLKIAVDQIIQFFK